MQGCGILSFPDDYVLDVVKYWAESSIQHIILLKNEQEGAELYPYFEEELNKLLVAFEDIYKTLVENQDVENPYQIFEYFMEANNHFILLLERLKFEGFNGYPNLYQVTYHMLYEQLYAQEIFKYMNSTTYQSPEDVLIQTMFRRIGLGNSPLSCIYGHMYFWCLIGAEHPSIIFNVASAGIDEFPEGAVEQFEKFRELFNRCNYELSSIYETLNKANLEKIFIEFKKTNEEFLALIEQFRDPEFLTEELQLSLPTIFFMLLDHIIKEHEYVLELTKKFESFFMSP